MKSSPAFLSLKWPFTVSCQKSPPSRRGPLQSNWIIMARHLLVWLLVSCEVNEWPPGRFTKSGCRLCSERLTKGCHLFVKCGVLVATKNWSFWGFLTHGEYSMKYSQPPNHPFWESRILSGNTCHEISDLCVVSLAFLRFNAFRCCRCSVESCTLQTTPMNSSQFFGCKCFNVKLTLALSLSLCQKASFCHFFFFPSFLRSVFFC